MTRNQPDPGTPRSGDRAPLLDEALTREVIGAFYKVYNTLGYGFLESVYSRALFIELRLRGLRVEREVKANGLRATELELDLLFHFGPRPAFYRVISEKSRK